MQELGFLTLALSVAEDLGVGVTVSLGVMVDEKSDELESVGVVVGGKSDELESVGVTVDEKSDELGSVVEMVGKVSDELESVGELLPAVHQSSRSKGSNLKAQAMGTHLVSDEDIEVEIGVSVEESDEKDNVDELESFAQGLSTGISKQTTYSWNAPYPRKWQAALLENSRSVGARGRQRKQFPSVGKKRQRHCQKHRYSTRDDL